MIPDDPNPASPPNPAPAPVPAPTPAGPTDWRRALTGEHAPLAAHKSLEVIKGDTLEAAVGPLVKGYVSAQEMIGKSIQIPGPDAKPEVIAAFKAKLGVPTDVGGYADVKLQAIEGLGEVDPTIIDNMAKPEFLKIGLTPKQGQDILNLYGAVVAKQRRDLAAKFVEMQSSLEDKWALNFDTNVTVAQRALRRYMGDEFMKFLHDSQLDMHPAMIEGFYNIGMRMAEDGMIDGNVPGAPTTEGVEKQIMDLRKEMEGMMEGTARWRDANQKLEQLYKTRYGTAQVTGPAMQRPTA